MKKNIDLQDISIRLWFARLGLDVAVRELFEELKEDPNGPEVALKTVTAKANNLWDAYLIPAIEELIGQPIPDPIFPDPDPIEPDEPDENMFGYKYKTRVMNSGDQMSHRDTNDSSKPPTKQDIFRVPGCGRNYGGKIMVLWSDGDSMIVKDAGDRTYYGTWDDKRKWQPGCGDGTTPGCEAYARVGSHPEYMDIYHDEKGTDEPGEVPEDGDWVTVEWGGDPNLDWHTDDSRDRTWWTEIHGKRGNKRDWSRKFPLPDDVEDARRLDFEFSDGTKLHVPNPREMAMLSGGPKYRPEEPGEEDPRKQHPKVGAVPGSPVTWVKYRKN